MNKISKIVLQLSTTFAFISCNPLSFSMDGVQPEPIEEVKLNGMSVIDGDPVTIIHGSTEEIEQLIFHSQEMRHRH